MTQRAVALPVRFDPAAGKFVTTTDPAKIWADRAYTALATQQRERVMLPGFGSKIGNLLMSSLPTDADDVANAVADAFAAWLPSLTLDAVQVTPPDSSGQMQVNVAYTFPGGDPAQVSVTLGTVSSDGTFTAA